MFFEFVYKKGGYRIRKLAEVIGSNYFMAFRGTFACGP